MPFRFCGLCNCPIWLTPLRVGGVYSYYESRGCSRCIHDDLYFYYKRQFARILRNDDLEIKLRKELRYAIGAMGIVEAERALVSAMQSYRVETMINKARSLQS